MVSLLWGEYSGDDELCPLIYHTLIRIFGGTQSATLNLITVLESVVGPVFYSTSFAASRVERLMRPGLGCDLSVYASVYHQYDVSSDPPDISINFPCLGVDVSERDILCSKLSNIFISTTSKLQQSWIIFKTHQ